MALFSTNNVDAFYKKTFEERFPPLAANSSEEWQDEDRNKVLTAVDDYPKRKSYYIKANYTNFNINSPDDLFDLTKLLTTEQSEAYTVYKAYSNLADLVEVGQFPAGASTTDMRHIFDTLIYPNIEAHYAKVLDSPNLDDITKNVLKAWWAESEGSLYEKYFLIAEDIEDVDSFSDLNAAAIDIRGIPNSSIKLRAAFFKTLFKKSGVVSSNVLDALGFSQFLRDNKGQFFTGVTEPTYTLEGLENAAITNPEAFARIVTTALNIPTDLIEEDLNELNQCALITGLVHKDVGLQFYNYIEGTNYPSSPLRSASKGNQRIYPVEINNYNPNKLVNHCVINKKVKNIFNTTDNKTPHNMVKGIFWVYEDNKDDASLREAELSTNSTIHRKKISSVFRGMSGKNSSEEDLKRFSDLNRKKDSTYYYLENTKITFDGTNPSTARNDVKVEMTWKLGSLEALNSTLAILSKQDGLDSDTVITIKDLITLPITKKPNASDGPGQFITNQYSPNYSRLRLKVAPYGDQAASHQSDCMILDLAIIDHQINRASETGETTLTITYRGYFEATLNMPFNDALASPQTINKRITRQKEALDKLIKNDCEPKLVREALRLEQEIFSMEAQQGVSGGTILLRMQGRGLIHSYELDSNKMRAGLFGDQLDGRQMYVTRLWLSDSPGLGAADNQELAEVVFNKKVSSDDLSVDDDDADRERTLKKIDKKFFFLGDLMWVLMDCLYKANSAQHRATVKNLNLRFIMGTIYVPNPKDLGGSPQIINPISIPVDLKFFIQWFNATVTNKGLTHYPVGTFIRDLVERLVNDVIYDTCFSLLLPDENPPLLRARTFVTNNTAWFKKNNGWFYPDNPFQDGKEMDLLFPKGLVSTTTSNSNTWSQEITSKNYCVIYQQFPSYKRQLASEQNGFLRDDPYCPSIYYGVKNQNFNFLSNVSFAKTNSPHLREARYFNTNYGGLSLLSNVYDLSFSFKRRKANTLLYPGCIINFILLDWGKRWVDETPWSLDQDGDPLHAFGTGILGDSDPHRAGTMADIMGMGGYFIIKSVEYSLGETPGEFEINISTKYLGNDAEKPLTKLKEGDKKITDKPECAAVFNNLAERFNELNREGQGGKDPIVKIDLSESSDNDNTGGSRASETLREVTVDPSQITNEVTIELQEPPPPTEGDEDDLGPVS